MKQSLGIIGVGAFGEFMLKHVTPYFDVCVFDAHRDLADILSLYHVRGGTLADAASCDVVVLAPPVKHIEVVAQSIAPYLRAGQLVMDVASVKVQPTEILKKILPDDVDLVGLHPLFGPQSGKFGIHGLNIAVCPVRGDRHSCVVDFLKQRFGLNVFETTAEEHDLQMAYVQGLTHLISKVFVSMKLPDIQMKTKTFSLLADMVELVRYDSEELFRTIQKDNPYVQKTKADFFASVRQLEEYLEKL